MLRLVVVAYRWWREATTYPCPMCRRRMPVRTSNLHFLWHQLNTPRAYAHWLDHKFDPLDE